MSEKDLPGTISTTQMAFSRLSLISHADGNDEGSLSDDHNATGIMMPILTQESPAMNEHRETRISSSGSPSAILHAPRQKVVGLFFMTPAFLPRKLLTLGRV